MKTVLLNLLLCISSFSIAQDYCNYTEQNMVNFYGGSADEPYGLLELEDGKYLIYGTSYYSSSNQFKASLVRMNANDQIDSTFGTNGKANYTWDSRNSCVTAAIQEDGKILIGGYQAPGNGASTFRAYVARLHEDGSIDTTFGELGSKKLSFQAGVRCGTVGINPIDSGKIQVSIIGNSPSGAGILQLDAFGEYDSTFSEDGRAYYETGHMWQSDNGDAEFMEDGSVLIVGKIYEGYTRVMVTKIQADGTLDSNFAVDGTFKGETAIMYNFGPIKSDLDADENLFISATRENTPRKQYVFKLTTETGVLDSLFGENGLASSTNTDGFNTANDIEVESGTGDIYVVGTSSNSGWNSSIWKLDSDGVEVEHCNGDTMMIYNFIYDNGLQVVKELSNGDIKLIGISGVEQEGDGASQGSNFMIPRLSLAAGITKVNAFDFEIYPNPFQHSIYLKMDAAIEVDGIRILNQMGQTVRMLDRFEDQIDLSDLNAGLYIIEVRSGDDLSFHRIIKN